MEQMNEVNLKLKNLNLETFLLTGKINDIDLIEKLKKIVFEKSKNSNMNYKTNVKGKFTGFKGLSDEPDFHNFIRSIMKEIGVIWKHHFKIKDAWGNICTEETDEVLEHNHASFSGFCGILYLTQGGPGTYFRDFDLTVEEEVGKFVLFHPLLNHSVKKMDKKIERITIAFNMDSWKLWEENIKPLN
jgi:hypothetical protein